MAGVMHLTWYHLKRASRHRALILAVLALPLIGGLIRMLLPEPHARLICAWMCPAVCALLVFGLMWVFAHTDRISGLADGFRNAPLSGDALAISRVAAGMALLAVQISIFLVLSAITR